MIEPADGSVQPIQRQDGFDRSGLPNAEVQKPQKLEDVAAALAQTHLTHEMRPPELRFDDQAGFGGPKFEQQAIANMDILKLDSPEKTINALASFLVTNGADIDRNGSDLARDGAATLDRFLNLNATFAAMRSGPNR